MSLAPHSCRSGVWCSHAGKHLAAMSSPTGPSWVPRVGSEGGQGSVIGVVVMGSGPNDQLPAAGVRMKSVGPCSDCCPCNPATDRWMNTCMDWFSIHFLSVCSRTLWAPVRHSETSVVCHTILHKLLQTYRTLLQWLSAGINRRFIFLDYCPTSVHTLTLSSARHDFSLCLPLIYSTSKKTPKHFWTTCLETASLVREGNCWICLLSHNTHTRRGSVTLSLNRYKICLYIGDLNRGEQVKEERGKCLKILTLLQPETWRTTHGWTSLCFSHQATKGECV